MGKKNPRRIRMDKELADFLDEKREKPNQPIEEVLGDRDVLDEMLDKFF